MKYPGRVPAWRGFTGSRGAVLLLALVFMLMLAMVAATVMQTAVMQLRMAGNDQFMEEAMHRARAIATELSLNPDNFSLEGGIGDTNCPVGMHSPGCDRSQLQVPVSAVVPTGVVMDYRVTRREPLFSRGFPFREPQDKVSSSNSFDAAIFEIDVRIDGSGERLGSAHIVQGIAMRVPTFR
jgi:hypothetical protein